MRLKPFLLAFAVLAWPYLVFSAEPDELMHKKCLYPTVMVSPLRESSGGSGVIVRSDKVGAEYRNLVLTCEHNYGSKPEPFIVSVAKYEDWSTFKGYDTYLSRVYAADARYDLALVVFTSKTEMPVADLGFDEKLYIGTDVLRVGCGLLDEPRIDTGKVSALRTPMPGAEPLIRTTAFTVMGDSGGPLFHDNKLVGITRMIRAVRGTPMHNISYAIPLGDVKKWDASQKNSFGFVYKPTPQPVLPYLRLQLEGQMRLVPPTVPKEK